jgi:murein DD-endopeptidase MepM/ murein hydrolase activator NlpD
MVALAALAWWSAPAPADPPPAQRSHVVAQGDTLGSIAIRYHVSVAALVSANRLSGEKAVLRIGQRLVVPPAPASAVARTAPPAAKAGPVGKTSPESKTATGPVGKTTRAPASASSAPPSESSSPPPDRRVSTVVTRSSALRTPVVARGPRGLELTVPDFVDGAPPFAWPVEGPITSTFGRRRSAWHRGIDIKAERGAVVFAAAAGTVVASDVEPRYGRVVKIEHEDGFVTVYAHNQENLVEPGMKVAAGDPVAIIGRTGRATSEHLHFEIRRNGAVYNPLYLLPLPPQVGQVEETDEPTEENE